MTGVPRPAMMGLLTALLGLLVTFSHPGMDLEESLGLYLLFNLRGARPAPPEITVVSIDEISADRLGVPRNPDRWPRDVHARLVDRLSGQGAAAVGFDMTFHNARSEQEDSQLADALARARNVVLCEAFRKEVLPVAEAGGQQKGEIYVQRLVPPIPVLAESAAASAPFPLPRIPLRVNQCWLFKTDAGDEPTLPVAMFQVFALDVYGNFRSLIGRHLPDALSGLPLDRDEILANHAVTSLTRTLREIFTENPGLADRMLADLNGGDAPPAEAYRRKILRSLIRMYDGPDSMVLNFYGPPGTITTVPFHRMIDSPEYPDSLTQPAPDIRGKAVFIGLSGSLEMEQKDGFHTVFSQPAGLDISGVEIAATAFGNLVEDMPVRPLPLPYPIIVMVSWAFLVAAVCHYFATAASTMSIILLAGLYTMAAYHQFAGTARWFHIAVPLLVQTPVAFFGTLIWKYLEAARERQNIRTAFRYFVPEDVVERLSKGADEITRSSKPVFGSVLCSDGEQYAALSEQLDPEELSQFMNRYYETIFEPVRKHGGIITDVIGDSMMAIWAGPNPDIRLQVKSCMAAVDVARAVSRFNRQSGEFRLPTRMGLHCGPVTLGNVGGMDHYEYRAVGDAVNTAARLEGLNKELGTQILLSSEVLHQVDMFLTRGLGAFLVAGKSKAVEVHELICSAEESSPPQRDLCAVFAEAMDAFSRRSWSEAAGLFNQCLRIRENDGPSLFYLRLCRSFSVEPPDPAWNGFIHMGKS